MKRPVNLAAAKARLSELLERASQGEEIVIARNGKPRARLVPLVKRVRRVPGRGAGQWNVSPDFNAALSSDVLEAFDGNS